MSYKKLQAREMAWGCGDTKCRACYEWVTVFTRRELAEMQRTEREAVTL